jgi:hypothetical protein
MQANNLILISELVLALPPASRVHLVEVFNSHIYLINNSPYEVLSKEFTGELRNEWSGRARKPHPLFNVPSPFFNGTSYNCQYTHNLYNSNIKSLVLDGNASIGPYLTIHDNPDYLLNNHCNPVFENDKENPNSFFDFTKNSNKCPGTIWVGSDTDMPITKGKIIMNNSVHLMDLIDYFRNSLQPFTPKLTTNLSPEFVKLINITSETKSKLEKITLDNPDFNKKVVNDLLRCDTETLGEVLPRWLS